MITKVVLQRTAHPLHSGCADPCDFPKRGKLYCRICSSGGLRSRFPLKKKKKSIVITAHTVAVRRKIAHQ